MDKIDVYDDPRVSHHTANLNGRQYHYLLALPKGEIRHTVFLIHGWPDISMGWRYQIPLLLNVGLRVVCPDIMGFGRTDAPAVPPESISHYSFKRAADDIKELAKQIGISQIILGGHDWGGAIVYRVALWHPGFVTHLFSVCTPYFTPSNQPYVPVKTLVEAGILPTFRYQLQLVSGVVEKEINSEEKMRQFINGAYGGSGPDGQVAFTAQTGVLFDNLAVLGPSPLMTKREVDYYTEEYMRNGVASTLNWYKNGEINHQEEMGIDPKIDIPTLFIAATHDVALLPSMSAGMEDYIPKLTRKEVDTSHWALVETPEKVNGVIEEWLADVVFGDKRV